MVWKSSTCEPITKHLSPVIFWSIVILFGVTSTILNVFFFPKLSNTCIISPIFKVEFWMFIVFSLQSNEEYIFGMKSLFMVTALGITSFICWAINPYTVSLPLSTTSI